MEHYNAAIIPIEPRQQLSKNKDKQDVDPTKYMRLIESLRYLCNTRPNLAFSVGVVSRFTGTPKVSHLTGVKRILRYVKCFVDCGILFPGMNTGRICNLLYFIDFNWCGDKDYRKSTAGYIFMFGGKRVSWCSNKESVVALSSCEAQYISALLCACQVVWLMNLLEELGINEGEVVTLLVDNAYTVNLAKNPIAHGRSKHIEMRFHYLRELISEGRL
ncbi:secreted RxLR effector protein 161-like [Lathyrus oleraceus]|uniref:secreted RxLR effector protein 161-like n=1 Tax=Pisum sativum TaxID=3888 RepID=UPI0021D305DD|nr:secreted RxLR effector protein 161-like [Pisum sativum]